MLLRGCRVYPQAAAQPSSSRTTTDQGVVFLRPREEAKGRAPREGNSPCRFRATWSLQASREAPYEG